MFLSDNCSTGGLRLTSVKGVQSMLLQSSSGLIVLETFTLEKECSALQLQSSLGLLQTTLKGVHYMQLQSSWGLLQTFTARRGNELIRPQASTYPTPLLTTLLNPCLKLITLMTTMMTMRMKQARKPRNYASQKLCSVTQRLTRAECRAINLPIKKNNDRKNN